MIGVIEYGAGNVGSVMNALGRLGARAAFVPGPEQMPSFDKILFPGDGHFGSAMAALDRSGYAQALREWLSRDRPFLGICIGLQLLFDTSEEAPGVSGLGVIRGGVKKFPCRKIPQIGWNRTFTRRNSGKTGGNSALPHLFRGLEDAEFFYYIHSFYAAPTDDAVIAAEADYGLRYCSAVERGSLCAVQFHPEKSGEAGLALLRNWAAPSPPIVSGFRTENSARIEISPSENISTKEETFGNPLCPRTLAKRIIPCLDVDDGRVVKGVKFSALADAGDPVELARKYNEAGADELVFLDIGASYKSRATLLEAVERVAREVFIPLCVGGGVRTLDDMRLAMNAGADKVSVCTAALSRPPLLRELADAYGRQCVVLSLDAKRVPAAGGGKPQWHAFSHGGRNDTGLDAIEWAAEAAALGAGEILLNSIDADGTAAGYDLELTAAVLEAAPVPVIASGGAGTLEQIARAAELADAVLAASVLHFGKMTVPQIKTFLREREILVR
jgi:cyclase